MTKPKVPRAPGEERPHRRPKSEQRRKRAVMVKFNDDEMASVIQAAAGLGVALGAYAAAVILNAAVDDENKTAWSVEVRNKQGKWVDTINVVMPREDATLENALIEALATVREGSET